MSGVRSSKPEGNFYYFLQLSDLFLSRHLRSALILHIFAHLFNLLLTEFCCRYNMEKFAGQPIDTLADSRRWVMNGCRLLGSGLVCGGIFCRVLCGMKVAHNAQPRVENWWFWRQQLIVEFIWGRTKTVFGLINKIDRGIRADEIWNSNDFVSSFYCVFMKMLRYSKQMFLSFIKAHK